MGVINRARARAMAAKVPAGSRIIPGLLLGKTHTVGDSREQLNEQGNGRQRQERQMKYRESRNAFR